MGFVGSAGAVRLFSGINVKDNAGNLAPVRIVRIGVQHA